MKKVIIFFLISQIYILLSNYPIIQLASRTPKDSIYTLIDVDRFGDYNGYLSAITQGQNGFLFFHNPYTNEKVTPNIFYLPYLASGWLTKFFHIAPFVVYHIMKILVAEVYCLALYIFCVKLMGKNNGWLASLTALTATVPPSFIFNLLHVSTNNSWWRLQDAFYRLSDAPHHLLGEALLIISFIFLLQAIHKPQITVSLFAGVSAFICGIVFPPSVLPFIAVSVGILFLNLFSDPGEKKRVKLRYLILPLFFAFSSVGTGLFQLNQDYYREIWSTWEVTRWNLNEPDFNKIFLSSLNFFPFFVLIYFIQLIKKTKFIEIIKDRNNISIIIWSLLPFFLIPFATVVGLSKIRLYAMMPFVPLSLIFCLVVFRAFQKNIARMLIFFVIILNFLTSISLLIQNANVVNNQPLYSNIYYPTKEWDAINFLKNEAPNKSIILSDEHIGNILPAFIPVTSYFGHINLTVDFKEKQNNVWRFYTARMDEKETKRFISENHISYVWFGADEKALGNKTVSYPFLKSIYKKGEITIYKVI